MRTKQMTTDKMDQVCAGREEEGRSDTPQHDGRNPVETVLTLDEVVQLSGLTRKRIGALLAAREFPPPLPSNDLGWSAKAIYEWVVAKEALDAVNERWWATTEWEYNPLRGWTYDMASLPVSPATEQLEKCRETCWAAEKESRDAAEKSQDAYYTLTFYWSHRDGAERDCGIPPRANLLTLIKQAISTNTPLPCHAADVQMAPVAEEVPDREENGHE